MMGESFFNNYPSIIGKIYDVSIHTLFFFVIASLIAFN